MNSKPKTFVYAAITILAALPCVFFCWYTIRVVYLYSMMPADDPHRSGGMMIGIVAFPLASLIFGSVSLVAFIKARRSNRSTN